jgi:hypothetical protein
MDTSCACAYATIYYSFHKEMKLASFSSYVLYTRLIDDAFIALETHQLIIYTLHQSDE